jgi:hypothetical protein
MLARTRATYCFHEIDETVRTFAEARAARHIENNHHTGDLITTIGVAMHIDVPTATILQHFDTVESYAATVIDHANDVVNNKSEEFVYWSTFESAEDIHCAHSSSMTLEKAQAVFSQLHSPTLGTPNIKLVLREVHYDVSNTTPITVSPYDADTVSVMKTERWPRSSSGCLDIWLTTIGDGILGFATFPFANEPQATFGVVADYRTTSTLFGNNNYNRNRTLVHEIGHCLGLFHVFSDPSAPIPLIFQTDDNDEQQEVYGDGIKDTPRQYEPTFGNPLVDNHNNPGNVAFVNYMDYTDDAACFAFTDEQVARMHYFVANDVSTYVADINITNCGTTTTTDGENMVVVMPVTTEQQMTTETEPSSTGTDSGGTDTWMIVAIVFIVLTVLLLGALIAVLRRK